MNTLRFARARSLQQSPATTGKKGNAGIRRTEAWIVCWHSNVLTSSGPVVQKWLVLPKKSRHEAGLKGPSVRVS